MSNVGVAGGSMGRAALVGLALLGLAPPASSALARYVTPEDLAARSPIVVQAIVRRTASGLDPDTGGLHTYVTLELEIVHRGPRSLDEIVLRELGGRYGSWVHELDAVPSYTVGERVLAFLEPAPDGALRTSGMFFGKFALESDEAVSWASRDLDALGTLPRRTRTEPERFALGDLEAVVAGVPARGGSRAALARPPEYDRLQWDPVGAPGLVGPRFSTLSGSNPARWFAADSDTPVKVHVDPAGNPLGDAAAAVEQMNRAFAAWTSAPEARLRLQIGEPDYDFRATHAASPADKYAGTNVMLFDDPYEDIPDPTNCSGVLAIGGYWRGGSPAGTVNGVVFYPAHALYVIFNDNFSCVLADPDDLAEVATHELGHGIGFGHSSVYDAIMRPSIQGQRGARLGLDDRDAAHCSYPHTLNLLAPRGGEAWQVGHVATVSWSTTVEAGPDPGVVRLEHSRDGGATWSVIADGVPNDGSHPWVVPDLPGTAHRLRVIRPSLTGANAPPFPAACSADASDASFSIVAPALVAGAVSDLRLGKEPDGTLGLSWLPSCSSDADDYAVYTGSLDALRAGSWDLAPATCFTGVTSVTLAAPAGDRYFLVAARAGSREGHLGRASDGTLRPETASACAPRESVSGCD